MLATAMKTLMEKCEATYEEAKAAIAKAHGVSIDTVHKAYGRWYGPEVTK